MYYVYVLENQQGRHYIGSCENIAVRLRRHNQNSIRSTKHKGPFNIIYKKEFNTRTEARQRENQLKRNKGDREFKELINK
jgi:putative endonuclease